MITFKSEKSLLTLPEIHRLDQHRGLSFFPHLDWYISNCNGHVVLGVDGGPCAPESTEFYATCKFRFKDIADVAPLCGTKIESLENDVHAVENTFRGKNRKFPSKWTTTQLNHNSTEATQIFMANFSNFPLNQCNHVFYRVDYRPLHKTTHILNPAIFTGLWSNDYHKGG